MEERAPDHDEQKGGVAKGDFIFFTEFLDAKREKKRAKSCLAMLHPNHT